MMRKTIVISDAMDGWIKTQIKNGRYEDDSDYVRDLIRRDQDRYKAAHDMFVLVQEGMQSGISPHNVFDIMKTVEDGLDKNGQLPAHD